MPLCMSGRQLPAHPLGCNRWDCLTGRPSRSVTRAPRWRSCGVALTPALTSAGASMPRKMSSVVNAQNVILSLKYATRYGASLHIDAQLRTPEQHAWASRIGRSCEWWLVVVMEFIIRFSPKEGTCGHGVHATCPWHHCSHHWRAVHYCVSCRHACDRAAQNMERQELTSLRRLQLRRPVRSPQHHKTASYPFGLELVQTCWRYPDPRAKHCDTALSGTVPCAKHACNTAIPCPVDCKVSDWGAWSSCSQTCNTGTQDRTRNVTGLHMEVLCVLLSKKRSRVTRNGV